VYAACSDYVVFLAPTPGESFRSTPTTVSMTKTRHTGDDDSFIVLTETKFSICYIPVWARYLHLRTRVKAHAMTLSP
jgi:hypothetical protein